MDRPPKGEKLDQARIKDWARRVVDAAPPLTPEQRELVALLLGGR